jgi:hypothetical protein
VAYGCRPVGRLLVVLGIGVASVTAQELTPRFYAPAPTGGNIEVLGYGRSTGEVLFDPSLPFDDVNATINTSSLLYARTFSFFGRSANVGIGLPYVWGEIDGYVEGQYARVSRSGLADLRAQLTVNILGGPALTPKEFASVRPDTVVGLSLVVAGPTGQYDPAKLINIGSNRWSVEQSPIGTFQAHVGHTFRPRLWLAADATFYTGGGTRLNGTDKADTQSNSRLGVTLAVPVGRRSSLKVSWATGFTTRIGADFDTLGVALQTVWFGKP